jgi:hypothetical protein
MNSDERGGMDIHWSDGGGPSLGTVAMMIGIAFAVTLAIVIGKKLSTDALAIVIGVGIGILASLPAMGVLLVSVLIGRRRREEEPLDNSQQSSRAYPPVVVIQGGSTPQLQAPGYWPAPAVQSPEYDTVAPGYRVLGQE